MGVDQIVDTDRPPVATPAERAISIGTWNMDHWRRTAEQRRNAWAYLRDGSGADVMLLQESVRPHDVVRHRIVHREIAGSRPWGSAVMMLSDDSDLCEIDAVRTRHGATRFSMLGSYPGAVVVARVNVPVIGAITCVSVYGVINVYSQTTMFRVVADLIPLFDSPDGERVVLGGDFNVTTATKPDAPELARYRAALAAIESLGLVNLAHLDIDRPAAITDCVCGDHNCRHLRTFGGKPGTQLDWLYATPELARRCTRLRVDHAVMGTLSDHAPIIADFRVSPLETRRVVDPDSFLSELARRTDSALARVAEGLIEWALRTHHQLDAGGPRIASLDRLPTSSGDVPELWVQLDLRRPQGLQYTFSLTADGRVVIQFQHMTAPFDKADRREWLWGELAKIDGIALEKRLNGRPSLPLTSLASTEHREHFERVFSQMIDETIRLRCATGQQPDDRSST